MKHLVKLGIIGSVLSMSLPGHANPVNPLGYWRTEEGKAKVHIYKCDQKTETLCGKIIELKEPKDTNGNPKQDPNGALIQNMEIMKNFKQQSSHEWTDGTIYDPKEGKTYDALFTLSEKGDQINLRGYVVFSFIGKTQTWQRVGINEPLK